jgi:hypothetical protein
MAGFLARPEKGHRTLKNKGPGLLKSRVLSGFSDNFLSSLGNGDNVPGLPPVVARAGPDQAIVVALLDDGEIGVSSYPLPFQGRNVN